jgi:hypothetical protein
MADKNFHDTGIGVNEKLLQKVTKNNFLPQYPRQVISMNKKTGLNKTGFYVIKN